VAQSGDALMVYMYQIYLGGVGSKIAKHYIELGMTPPIDKLIQILGKKEALEQPRAVPGVEIQIFDLARESVIKDLIDKKMIKDGDEYIQLKISSELLEDKGQRLREYFSVDWRKYTPILKYWNAKVKSLIDYLGPGRGVQRYRPLARALLVARETIDMVKTVLQSDIDEDIKREPPIGAGLIVSVAFNAGGGFGSGSFIDIVSLFDRLLAITYKELYERTNYIFVVNLPIGAAWAFKPEDAPAGVDHLHASAIAALADLLYLLTKDPDKGGYIDNLVREIGRATNIEKLSYGFAGRATVILTSYSNISGRNIDEVYNNHDRYMSRLLAAISSGLITSGGNVLPFIHENVIRAVKNVEQALSECARSRGYPDAVAFTCVIAAIKSIEIPQVEKPEELTNMLKNVRELEPVVNELESRERQIRGCLESVNQEIRRLEDLKSRIDKLSGGEMIKLSGFEEVYGSLDDLRKRISGTLEALNSAKVQAEKVRDYYGRHDFGNAEASLKSLLRSLEAAEIPKIETVLENPKIIERSKEALRKLEVVRIDEKSVEEVETLIAIYQILESIRRELGGLQNSLNDVERVVQGLRDTAKNDCDRYIVKKLRSECRIYSYIDKAIIKAIEDLKAELSNYGSKVKSMLSEISGRVNQFKVELDRRLRSLEKENEERRKELDKLSAELNEKREELNKARESISKYGEEYIRRLLEDLVAAGVLHPSERDTIVDRIMKNPDYFAKFIERGEQFKLSDLFSIADELGKTGYNINSSLLINRLVDYLKVRARDYPFANIDIDKHLKTLGLTEPIQGMGQKVRVLYYTEDVDKFIDDIRAKLEVPPQNCITVKAKGSLIMNLEYQLAVPILAIREVREMFKKFFEEVNILVSEDRSESEPRGYQYLALELSDEYRKMLEGIKRFIEEMG